MTIAPELVVAAILFGLVIALMSARRRPGTQQSAQLRTAKPEDFRPPGQAPVARPVYHRQPKKNRRDAPRECNGIAFLTTRTDGVGIPSTCQSCGQQLQVRYLDFSQVVETRLSSGVARLPRHYGAKGIPVIEIDSGADGLR